MSINNFQWAIFAHKIRISLKNGRDFASEEKKVSAINSAQEIEHTHSELTHDISHVFNAALFRINKLNAISLIIRVKKQFIREWKCF